MIESLKQLRSLFATLLTVSLLWFVTAQPTVDALVRRAHAKELLAWLTVRDALNDPDTVAQLSDPDIVAQLGEENGGVITYFIKYVPVISGTEEEAHIPIAISLPLLEHAIGTLQLTPSAGVEGTYQVSSDVTAVPLSSYAVAIIENQLWVLPSEAPHETLRDFYNDALRDGLAAPRNWPAMKAELYSSGWSGSDALAIKLNDPTISKFLSQAFSVSFSVAGIPIPAPFYPSAVSAFICLLGFLMLGPLLIMRHSSGSLSDEPWIMVAKEPGTLGSVLIALQVLIVGVFALLPLGIYISQARFWSLLEPTERIIWIIPSTLLLAVPVVIALVARRVWQIRSQIYERADYAQHNA